MSFCPSEVVVVRLNIILTGINLFWVCGARTGLMRIINDRLIRTLFIIQQNFIRTKYFDRESDLLQYSQPLWIVQLENISMKLFLQHHHHTPRCSLVLTTTTILKKIGLSTEIFSSDEVLLDYKKCPYQSVIAY